MTQWSWIDLGKKNKIHVPISYIIIGLRRDAKFPESQPFFLAGNVGRGVDRIAYLPRDIMSEAPVHSNEG